MYEGSRPNINALIHGTKNKSVYYSITAKRDALLSRQILSEFYSQDSLLCSAAETIENIASLLSEKHYLNKISRFSVLIWP